MNMSLVVETDSEDDDLSNLDFNQIDRVTAGVKLFRTSTDINASDFKPPTTSTTSTKGVDNSKCLSMKDLNSQPCGSPKTTQPFNNRQHQLDYSRAHKSDRSDKENNDTLPPLVSYSKGLIQSKLDATTTLSYPYGSGDSQTELTSTLKKRAKFEQEYLRPTNPTYRDCPGSSLLSSINTSSSSSSSANDADLSAFLSQHLLSENVTSISPGRTKAPKSEPTTTTNTETSFYGLPLKVKQLLKDVRKITSLYDWQDELLTIMLERYEASQRRLLTTSTSNINNDELFSNLLYLSPTSAGKTLVAELIILHCLLVRRRNCIFVMPFVSIVQEKVAALAEFADALGFSVEEYAGVKGRVPPARRLVGKAKSTLYVCTIEKAHSLVNSLIETERLADEVGLVVADELHMIGDGPRGAIYEMILSKVNYCSEVILANNETKAKSPSEKRLPIQIVATTATLQNKQELADFLKAYLYEREFRPVELKEYIKLESQIFEVDKTRLHLNEELENIVKLDRELDLRGQSQELKRDDPDGIVALIKEVIPEHSCLIFCSTKKNCENLANLLCSHLPPELKLHKRELKLKLYADLREENANNICDTLRKSIQFGIAYHHSGLTTEERQLIEQAYRDGVLCLLTCTSTLAAGVNLPAKRVIIRSPYVAMDFISSHQYRQMIGRAGRAGLVDSVGESILVFKHVDRQRVLDLISGPMRRCESSFECADSKAVRLLVLSLVGLNLTHLGSQILRFFRQTLFFMQQRAKMDVAGRRAAAVAESEHVALCVPREFEIISSALDYLIKAELVKVNTSESVKSEGDVDGLDALYFCKFEVTKLGLAAIKGNVDLDHVHQLHADLKNGLKTMVLSNYLHLLYLCTPYDLVSSLMNVDFDIYARKYINLTEDEIKCACLIGIKEEHIQKKRFQNKSTNKKVDENAVKRFYITLVIYELWKTNNSIWKVSSEFQLDRGFIQNIVQSAASFTSGVTHFCAQLDELWPYKNLLEEFTKRLQFNCSSVDLIPLLELDSVRLARAKQLFAAGYTSIESVAASKADDMCAKVRNLQLPVARRIIKSANEKIEALQAEADVLFEQLHVEDPNET